jgi:hypothetical protein
LTLLATLRSRFCNSFHQGHKTSYSLQLFITDKAQMLPSSARQAVLLPVIPKNAICTF